MNSSGAADDASRCDRWLAHLNGSGTPPLNDAGPRAVCAPNLGGTYMNIEHAPVERNRTHNRMTTQRSTKRLAAVTTSLLGVFAAMTGGANANADTPPPSAVASTTREVRADAPDGFLLENLGRPVDANFVPLVGVAGASLFPQAGKPSCAQMGSWSAEQNVVETNEELSANASAWGIGDAHAQFQSGHQYAYFRAAYLSQACQINDSTAMVQPPAGAVYYVAKVLVGASYSTVLDGSSSQFNAGAKAEFHAYNGKLDLFKKNHELNSVGRGKGLEPTTAISLFSEPSNVARNYRMNRNGDPIIVVYRQIPGARVNAGAGGPPAATKTIDFRFTGLNVQQSGSSVHDFSNWKLTTYCNLNGNLYGERSEFPSARVTTGTNPLSFSQSITASDSDVIECFAEGTYTRGSWGVTTTHTIPRVSTGLIRVGRLPQAMSTPGGDGTAKFSISWAATKL